MSTAEMSTARLAPTDPVRLLPRPSAIELDEHVARFGPRPLGTRDLIDQVEAAGLRGRGGAGFPTATKLRAVAARSGGPVVVANGTEGEPASAKDKVLLQAAPHLVLDGIELAAELLGAADAYLCIDRNWPDIQAAVARAAQQRPITRRRYRLQVASAPDRYVAGEETALVHWLSGGEAKPTLRAAASLRAGGARSTHADQQRGDLCPTGPHRPLRSGLVPGPRAPTPRRAPPC